MSDSASLTSLSRSEKNAARRARQRELNPKRAAKMHTERIAHPLASAENNPPALNIGCSGWFYWDWKGVFYPADMTTKDWFDYYARHFSTVELNAPFYSWPSINTVKTWLRQIDARDFIYTIKVPELITHVKRFEEVSELIQDFGYTADLLGAKMGCFLFQMPPSYSFTAERLEQIVSQLDPQRRNVMELRHVSWWNETVYTAFREHGVIFCSCSGPKLPDELVRTADEIYVRLHGTQKWYLHDYSDQELRDWADKIRRSGAKRAWVYFNNDYHGNAIRNAIRLQEMLEDYGLELGEYSSGENS